MKILIEPTNSTELTELAQIGSLHSLNGVFMNYSNYPSPGNWSKDIEYTLRTAPFLPVIGLVPTTSFFDSTNMVATGTMYSKIPGNKFPAISVPPTWQGLNACKFLRKEKFLVTVGPCETVLQALLAANANATFVGLFNYVQYRETSLVRLKIIQEIREAFDKFPSLNTQILVTSVRSYEQLNTAISYGADAVCLSRDLLLTNIPIMGSNQPLD